MIKTVVNEKIIYVNWGKKRRSAKTTLNVFTTE